MTPEPRSDYYAAMADSHEATAVACDCHARAYTALRDVDGARHEQERAATYRRLALSYRQMAEGKYDAASETLNEPVVVGECAGIPVTVDPQ